MGARIMLGVKVGVSVRVRVEVRVGVRDWNTGLGEGGWAREFGMARGRVRLGVG